MDMHISPGHGAAAAGAAGRHAPRAGSVVTASRAGWIAGIAGLHLLVLLALSQTLDRSEPRVEPPTVIGMLVAPPPTVEPPKPLPIEPEPTPPPVVKPLPKPVPRPALPPPVAPRSERAVAAPPPAPPTPAAPPPDTAPPPPAPPAPPEPAPPPPAPVTPPRTDASHLNNPAPVYPTVAKRLREQGKVLIDVYILADGSVGEIKLKRSSGHERLDNAALDAVSRWRFVPARRGDTPIPYWYVQPIDFTVEG